MCFDEDIGFPKEPDRLLVLADFGFLVEPVELHLRCRLGAEADMDEARLPVKRQQFLVAIDIGDAGVDAPFHLVGQTAVDQFLTELDKGLAVDGRFLVREDEEADAVLFVQLLDFIDHVFRVAHAVIAPELPLRTETSR